MRSILLLAAIAILATPTATAQALATPETTLKKFGLFGHLADDCATPISDGHIRYLARKDGTVDVDSFTSRARPSHSLISKAKILSPTEIELFTTLQVLKQSFTTVWEKKGQQFRLKSSKNAEGVYTIKDHHGVDSGREYHWLNVCPD